MYVERGDGSGELTEQQGEDDERGDFYLAVTQELLKTWLRKNYNVEIEVYRTATDNKGNKYGCQGYDWNDNGGTDEIFNIYDIEYENAYEFGLQLALDYLKDKNYANE